MAAPRLLTCPICAQPGFPSVDALRSGLVCAATRPLACPVCAEVLLGLDKFTIHLFGHSLSQQQPHGERPDTGKEARPQASSTAHAQTAPSPSPARAPSCDVCALSLPDESLLHLHRHLAHAGFPPQRPNSPPSESRRRSPPTAGRSEASPRDAEARDVKATASHVTAEALCGLLTAQLQAEQRQVQQRLAQHLLHQQHMGQTKQTVLPQNASQQTQTAQQHTEQQFQRHGNLQQVLQLQQRTPSQCNVLKNTDQQLQRQLEYRRIEHEKPHEKTQLQERFEDKHLEQSILQQNQRNQQSSDDLQLQDTNALEYNNVHFSQNEQEIPEKRVPHVTVQTQTQKQKELRQECSQIQNTEQQSQSIHVHQQQENEFEQNQPQAKKGRAVDEERSGNDGQLAFPCHLCSKAFKMRGSLMVHLRVAHSGINAGKILRSWVESTQQQSLQEPDAKAFACTTCGKSFKKEQQLCQHQKTHEGKQWECDICSKLFTTKYFLKKHKRLHTGEMPYSCPTCNKTFTFQQSYHKHLLYHSDEKPHVCTECDRAFKELSTLHNHQRIHTGEKPFACETCGKCFRQRVSYLVHRRIHTGAMPYQCTACGKNFRYKVSQRTHKCPAQPPGTVVRQSGELIHRLLQNVQQKENGFQTQENPSKWLLKNTSFKMSPATSKDFTLQQIKPEQISKMDVTNTECLSLPKENQQPQANNQFIILLEGDIHHGLSPGLLVTAPPLFMLSSDGNSITPSAQWSSREISSHSATSQELPHESFMKSINNRDFSSQLNKTENLEEYVNNVTDKSTGKEGDLRQGRDELCVSKLSELHNSESQELPKEEWFRMESNSNMPQTDTNKLISSSKSPDLIVQTTDFFKMAMSPSQSTNLLSPSESFRQLTLATPDDINHQEQGGPMFQFLLPSSFTQTNSYTSKKESFDAQEAASEMNPDLVSNTPCKNQLSRVEDSSHLLVTSDLQTINEESLKQLLYGSTL